MCKMANLVDQVKLNQCFMFFPFSVTPLGGGGGGGGGGVWGGGGGGGWGCSWSHLQPQPLDDTKAYTLDL